MGIYPENNGDNLYQAPASAMVELTAPEYIHQEINKAVTAERERCAKIADNYKDSGGGTVPQQIARLIRAQEK